MTTATRTAFFLNRLFYCIVSDNNGLLGSKIPPTKNNIPPVPVQLIVSVNSHLATSKQLRWQHCNQKYH